MTRRLLVLVLLVGLPACRRGPAPATAPTADAGRVAVLPFRAGGTLGADGGLQPGASPVADAEEVGAEFARTLAERLATAGAQVVEPEVSDGVLGLVGAGPYDAQVAARVAQRTGATLAVLGAVRRYRQRVGSAWGAEEPASVAYDVALVRAADAHVLRLERFAYTQRPLSENLLDLPRFVSGRGRWQTREEIRDSALTRTAEQFAAVARQGWSGP